MKKGVVKQAFVHLGVICFFVVVTYYGLLTVNEWYLSTFGSYRDIDAAFDAAHYSLKKDNLYEKKHHGLVEQIRMDYVNNRAIRNGFSIDITNAYFCNVRCFVQIDKIEEIILSKSYDFNMFGIQYAPLIAHAGGGYRTREKTSTYTNAYEAIAQNYGLGHRFFELDFEFTADKKLVAVHEWEKQDHVLTEHEWLTQPYEEEQLHHLTFTKVLELMLIHRDMFLITDSKVFEVEETQRAAEYNYMYETIMRYDDTLLARVIPQIYAPDMLQKYSVLTNFPHVILTGYALSMTRDDILATLDENPQIQMFTTDILGSYIDDHELTEGVKSRARKLSIHTVNDIDAFTDERYVQVDGYYTDFLTPSDWRQRGI